VTLAGHLATSLQAASTPDQISAVPFRRWDLDSLWRGKPLVRARFGGFLQNVANFDCAAFGISVPEAELMDPQQRLLLEVSIMVFSLS
jgi:acyl transferase domain-containing protein